MGSIVAGGGILSDSRYTFFQPEMTTQRNHLNTREIPAFGEISLDLRGSGAFGTTFRAPSAPRLGRLRGHN